MRQTSLHAVPDAMVAVNALHTPNPHSTFPLPPPPPSPELTR
jgi:hypothetical protein